VCFDGRLRDAAERVAILGEWIGIFKERAMKLLISSFFTLLIIAFTLISSLSFLHVPVTCWSPNER
jgi:hypothetical protein